ncbi:TPA: hypothetical protein ACLGWU_000964 [Salmonella enterica]
MSHIANNDNLLSARIDALKQTAANDRIQQAMTGFVVEAPLDIAQLKQHAHLLRKKLQAKGITLKPRMHRNWLFVCMVSKTGRQR